MAEAAAARREARRRRILENSENRLRVISGLNKAGDVNVSSEETSDHVRIPPPLKKDESPFESSQHSSSDMFETPSVFSLSSEEKSYQSQMTNDLQSPSFPLSSNDQFTSAPLKQTEISQSFISAVIFTRMHLISLAVFVRILLSTNQGFWIGESVFVPLLTLLLIKYCGLPSSLHSGRNDGGILNAVLLLSGLPAQRINRILQILGALKEVMEDLYTYFFSFIMFHVFLELLSQ